MGAWAFAFAALAKHWRMISSASVLVLYPEGGFGYMLTGPDLARVLFPGEKVVVLFGYHAGRHNPAVARLWREPRLVLLQTGFLFLGLGQVRSLKANGALFKILKGLLRMILPRARVIDSLELFTIAHKVADLPPPTSDLGPDHYRSTWAVAYFAQRPKCPPIRLRLPDAEREGIRDGIIRKFGDPRPICCLYMRDKGSLRDYGAFVRIGSPFEHYMSAIGVLIGHGYRVLIAGDRPIPDDISARYSGVVLDDKSLGIDRNSYLAFAPSEADIFIGDTGGGSWLSGMNGIPNLLLNVFPYYIAAQDSTLCFKTLRDPDGRLVRPEELFSTRAWSFDVPEEYVLQSNSSELIKGAVTEFLDNLDKPRPWGIPVERIAPNADPLLWSRLAPARVSPAWARQFD
jgi:hypothetical protein